VVIIAASFVGGLTLDIQPENKRVNNKFWCENPFRGDDFENQEVGGSITYNFGRRGPESLFMQHCHHKISLSTVPISGKGPPGN
jgi:hypothetical protein